MRITFILEVCSSICWMCVLSSWISHLRARYLHIFLQDWYCYCFNSSGGTSIVPGFGLSSAELRPRLAILGVVMTVLRNQRNSTSDDSLCHHGGKTPRGRPQSYAHSPCRNCTIWLMCKLLTVQEMLFFRAFVAVPDERPMNVNLI